MRIRAVAITLAAAIVFAVAGCGPKNGSTCVDGTHSDSTGRGACSGHGGVRH
jgi:hypothetical protein